MQYQLKFPELAKALYLALKPDAFYQVMEDSVSGEQTDKTNAMLAYMDYSMIEAQQFGECFIPQQQKYGVSIWSKPIEQQAETNKQQLKKQFILENMGEKSYQAYQQMCDFMSRQSSRLVAENAWYLSIVGIVPDFQGQGLGPGLIENILEKTDKLGVASYLETFTPRNMTFYQRLGYQTLDSLVEPLSQTTYWLMQRPPITKG